MHILVDAGDSLRCAVTETLWDLEPSEGLLGDASFSLRLLRGADDALEMDVSRRDRCCTLRGVLPSFVAALTVRQTTTRGRLLTHVWAIAGANGSAQIAATQ